MPTTVAEIVIDVLRTMNRNFRPMNFDEVDKDFAMALFKVGEKYNLHSEICRMLIDDFISLTEKSI